jgi:quercetin dioxygenase-like cupin family protein
VFSGELEFKLEDDVVTVGPGAAVRVAPSTARSVWNEGPADAHLVIVSVKIDDPRGDAERVPDFWPA